jgi:hypothetical protein
MAALIVNLWIINIDNFIHYLKPFTMTDNIPDYTHAQKILSIDIGAPCKSYSP